MYVIVDIETTGARADDRIMEIAMVFHDGTRVVDEYSTLINPEKNIPYFINKLTGIKSEMVADAPKFYEVAKVIVERTQNCIFVAHNADFDYGFIRKEFKNLGYDYRRKKICTVKLAQKLIPSLNSYNLDSLCKEFGIINIDRHRALGDAMATAKVFEHLLMFYGDKADLFSPLKQDAFSTLHPALNRQSIEELPENPGVYFFYDVTSQLLYIGKSKNIYNRVISHLGNTSTTRAQNLRNRIASVKYEETGSELVAMLLESHLIKKEKPVFNRLQRQECLNYGLFSETDEYGYLRFYIEKIKSDVDCIVSFSNYEKAIASIDGLVKRYNLCKKIAGIYDTKGACFDFQVNNCKGACVGKEHPDTYNFRVLQAIRSFELDKDNIIIIDKGRSVYEKSVILVQNAIYKGFGFISKEQINSDLETILNCIQPYNDNKEVRLIIKRYLRKNKVEKLIEF